MLDHVGFSVSDSARSFPFYEAALAPLGIIVRERQKEWGSIVMTGERWPFLWGRPAGGTYYGTPVRVEKRGPIHLAFRASPKEAVEAYYRIGLTYGGRDNGAPEDCAAERTPPSCSIRTETISGRSTAACRGVLYGRPLRRSGTQGGAKVPRGDGWSRNLPSFNEFVR
jgi:hypothetical protein